MYRPHPLIRLLVLFVLCALGCDASPPNPSQLSEVGPAVSQQAPSDAVNAPVTLKLVTPQELMAELEMRRGKVLLLDMWATW